MKKHNKMIIVGIVFLFITSNSLSASNPKKSDNCVANPCESLMKHIQEDLSFETEGYMISGSKSINDLDLLKKTDDCYGFIVPIKNNDSIFYSSIQRSISNLVNDLLRLNNTVLWSSSDFVALTRKPYNDSTKIRSFEKGAFIIPLTKDDMSNAIIASIIHDYEYGSEIETQAPVDIYLLLEPLLEDVYPLEYPRVVLNFGSLVALMDIFWYVDVLQNGGFFDNQLLLDEQIPNALKNDDVTLFIWPGVITDIYIQRLLNSMIDPVLCTAIRDFVKNGGGYIGSCHGAITASSGQYLPFNILQSRLERFPVSTFLGLISDSVLRIRCGGIITVNFTDLNHPATFGLERTQKSMFIYGPVFQNRTMDKRSTIVGVLQDIEPLWWDSTYENIIKMDYERYVNERVGKPIWVESEFGEGRTFVFGDHPEFFLPNRHDRLMHNVFFYITANDAMSICLDTSVTFERILSYYSATDNLEIPDHKPLFLDINALSLSLNMTSIEIDDTVKRIFSRMITSFDEYGIDERLYTLFGFYLDPYQTWIDRFLVALKRLESISSISMNSMVISSIIDTWEQDITKELEDGFLFCQDVRDRLNLISEKVQSYVGSQREETDLFTLFEHLESSYKQGYNSLTRLVSLTTKAYREIWYRYEGERSVIEPRQIRLEFLNDQHKYIAEEQDGPRTFIVDDDSNYGGNGCSDHPFKDIQDAIDVAKDDDTVFVRSGIYYGHIRVDKSIKLIGEDKSTTIIDGERRPHNHVWLTASNVKISGFTIQNSGPIRFNSGISCLQSNNIIEDNILRDNCIGLGFYPSSSNNTVKNNYFINNSLIGLIIDEKSLDNMVISGNIFENNGLYGLYTINIQNSIDNNTFIHDGVTIEPSFEPLAIEFINNTVNGRPLVFHKDSTNVEISDAGQIILSNCSDITIKDITISNTDAGLYVISSSNISIINCTFSHNNVGLTSRLSENVIISRNSFSMNKGPSIWLCESYGNDVSNNRVNSSERGILLHSSSKNKIQENKIEGNTVGIHIQLESIQNRINDNIFVDNHQNAYDDGRNVWSHNYWDDWVGLHNVFLRFLPYNVPNRLFKNIDLHPKIDLEQDT